MSGELSVKDSIKTSLNNTDEKDNQIRLYQGKKYETSSFAEAGSLVGVTGLSHTVAGQTIGQLISNQEMLLQPVLSVSVIHPDDFNTKEILVVLKKLEDEDPVLFVTWNEITNSIEISVMGGIQLEVLKDIIHERFNLDIEFGSQKVIYQETISRSVIESWHYEPLKHYAEVHLELEPGPRGSGIRFESNCSIEDLDVSYQKLVRIHVFEKTHSAILTGSMLTDIKVKLLTGRAHQKYTSGGDFREATYRAIRQGLEQARNVLLEPYYAVKMEVEVELMGRVLTDLKKLYGEVDPPVIEENKCVIIGKVPVATFMDYPIEFLSYTKGCGRLSLHVLGYDVCHNDKQVIEQIAYDKDSDRLNPSGSVFCQKGSGFTVSWNEVTNYMHCKI